MSTTGTSSAETTASGATRPGGAGQLAGRTVSRIGYGAMQLRQNTDRAAGVAMLRRVVDLGVDHIDTAEFYGPANDFIREAIRPEDGVLVASKVGADPDPVGPVPIKLAQRPEQLRASVEVNLKSLGLDTIPLVNLRRTDAGPGLRATGDQIVDLDDQLATMVALRDEGKIGAIGLSGVSLEILRRALPVGIACVQNAYSLVSRADEEILALCTEHDIAWVPFFPLGGDLPGLPKVTEEQAVLDVAASLGVTPMQVGLAWLLHHAPNVLLIAGTSNPEHLRANVDAGAIEFDAETLAALDAVPTRSANIVLG